MPKATNGNTWIARGTEIYDSCIQNEKGFLQGALAETFLVTGQTVLFIEMP